MPYGTAPKISAVCLKWSLFESARMLKSKLRNIFGSDPCKALHYGAMERFHSMRALGFPNAEELWNR